ncbi:arginine-tRNA-protein transferase [Cryomyces antarcticus]
MLITTRSLSIGVGGGKATSTSSAVLLFEQSGNTFYKPDVRRSCCPHYTIRLPATQLKPAKDQRQALNRWNRFVLGETYVKETARLYPKSKVDKARQRNDFDLLSTVHESEYNTLKKPPEPEHRFEVSLEPDDFTEEKFRLFEDYQKNVHHDPPSQISRGSFKRFLCSSPLRRVSCSVNGIKQDHGSFHQCYRLDGRLIAMAVLDLLPHCVSGVYFLYHRDFEKWSFGKLSAMREAALAVEKGYEHYYMGYYIHSCAKMRYKGDYKPQFILDLETLQWNAMDDEMRALLDTQKYVSISRERRLATEQNEATEADKSEPDKHSGATVDQQYLFDDPAEAADSGLSLFDLTMPGMMTANEVMEHIDLDHMSLEIRGAVHRMEQLVSWQEGSLTDSKSLKGIVAELAACVGPDVSREITIKFG